MADRPPLFQELLKRGASLNVISTVGDTPLSAAVQAGPIDLVRKCLEAGANPSLGDPLHYAVGRNSDEVEIIRLLCSYNAPVNTIQFQHPSARVLRHCFVRGTPLHEACRLGKIEVVKELLRQGANPNSTRMRYSDIEPTTPIDIAREEGHGHVVALLTSVERSVRL